MKKKIKNLIRQIAKLEKARKEEARKAKGSRGADSLAHAARARNLAVQAEKLLSILDGITETAERAQGRKDKRNSYALVNAVFGILIFGGFALLQVLCFAG